MTATHTPDECPGYNHDKMQALIAGVADAKTVAQDLNIKVHFSVNGAPEHVTFLLLEADSAVAVARFVTAIPMRQDFKVVAVTQQEEMMAMAREMVAQG